jgi:hypothetical protein
MKKIVLFVCLLFVFSRVSAQISLISSITTSNAPDPILPYLTKFHMSGYKYVTVDYANLVIKVYNTNFSLFKTIAFPATVGGVTLNNGNFTVAHLSQQLFDLDSLLEYTMNVYTLGSIIKAKFYVFKENGTQIFFRDSAMTENTIAVHDKAIFNQEQLHFNGTGAVLRLQKTPYASGQGFSPTYLFYSLPGSLPCSDCSSGVVTGKQSIAGSETTNAVFYPNPVTDQLKLKYELPKDYKTADIKIYDLQGKLIETFKVTDTFDFIYLPSDYNNGLYLYSLSVDGKTIKTEKVILNK